MDSFISKGTWFLAGVVLASSVAAFAATGSFSSFKDVSPTAYYAEHIKNLKDLGVISGYADGRFGPDDFITRGQLATILSKYHYEITSNVYSVVNGLRGIHIAELKGKSWQEYTSSLVLFPYDFLDTGEGWDAAQFYKDAVLAYDGLDAGKEGIRIYAKSDWAKGESGTPFFIRITTAFTGDVDYGPFYDNVPRLIDEIKKSSTPQ